MASRHTLVRRGTLIADWLSSIDLARRGTARQEVAVELTRPELVRRYSLLQLWILVPFAIVAFALFQRGRSGG